MNNKYTPVSKLSLTRIKHFPEMSEETSCYTAMVKINGVIVADVKNAGHGGCTDVDIRKTTKADKVLRGCGVVHGYETDVFQDKCCGLETCALCKGSGYYTMDLGEAADVVLYNTLLEKEKQRASKKMDKKFKELRDQGFTHIRVSGDVLYAYKSPEGVTLDDVKETASIRGMDISGDWYDLSKHGNTEGTN